MRIGQNSFPSKFLSNPSALSAVARATSQLSRLNTGVVARNFPPATVRVYG